MDTSSCDEGTATDVMSTEEDHAVGDWRQGQSWAQILSAMRCGARDTEFRAWRAKMEETIKIGEEAGQEGAVTEAVKEMYLRLIFAYKEVVSENPKKPGIIPGIYHQIIFDRPKSEGVPGREPYRRGSWAEEDKDGWLAGNRLRIQKQRRGYKIRVVSTTSSNSMRSIKTAH